MYTFRSIHLVTTVLTILLLGVSTTIWAGPGDLGTDYKVKIEVGGFTGSGIADGGGTTSLSFTDAQAAGLLDANGDPVGPATSVTIGGTGGGAVKAYQFSNVQIKVTGMNASGVATGSTQTVTADLVVPKKPADQAGTPAQQTARTNSLTSKLGKNVMGQKVNGKKLDLIDTASQIPGKNNRATEWKTASLPDHFIPVTIGPLDHGLPVLISGVMLDSFSTTAFLSFLPTTLIPSSVASSIGLIPIGMFTLDADTQAALFTESFINTLPDTPLSLPFGILDVALPTTDGPFYVSGVAALINPQFDTVVLGGNALIPTNYRGFLDNTTSTFNLQAVPEPSTWLMFGTGLLGLLYADWRRRKQAT